MIQKIIDNVNGLYPNVLNLETIYDFKIENGKGKIINIYNVFSKSLPNKISLFRIAFDISLIKKSYINFVKTYDIKISKYKLDNDYNIEIKFKIKNGRTDMEMSNPVNDDSEMVLSYLEFFEALNKYLYDLSEKSKDDTLKRILTFSDELGENGMNGFCHFISDNLDLYNSLISLDVNNNSFRNTTFKNNCYQTKKNSTYDKLKTNVLCVLSFCFSFISIFLYPLLLFQLIGLVLGVCGVDNFDGNKEKNRSLGIIGIFISLIYLVLAILYFLHILDNWLKNYHQEHFI